MSRINLVTSSAIVTLTLLPSSVLAQQGTLRQQLVGTWRMTSCDFKAPSCPGNGSFSFGGNGQYTEVILGPDRPKLTDNPTGRVSVSADQYKGIGQGTVAQFGTWSVEEASKTLTLHSENTFTRVNEGTDRKVSISLTGDELKVVVADGGSTTWKKSPPLQQVAAVPAAAQQQTLKQQIQGAWNLVSCDAKQPYCVNPTGSLSLNGNGRYTVMIAAKGRPTAQRENVTPEAFKGITQGVAAQFGTWSVNEADKTITYKAEEALFPRPEGDSAQVSKFTIVSITADEMKGNGPLGNTVWRRFK